MGIYLVALPKSFRDTLTAYNFLFWMEWIGVWAFSFAWLAKGRIMTLGWELLKKQQELLLRAQQTRRGSGSR